MDSVFRNSPGLNHKENINFCGVTILLVGTLPSDPMRRKCADVVK